MSLSQEAGGRGVFSWQGKAKVLNSENSGGLEGGGGERKAVESGSIVTEAVDLPRQKRLRNGSLKGKEVVPVGGESEHEAHIWTERERRKKMKNMFKTLHALLPELPVKADKATIVEAAVRTIKELEATLRGLQKEKLERIRGTVLRSPLPATAHRWQATSDLSGNSSFFPLCFQTWSSPKVVLSVSGADAHINVCAVTKPGLLSDIVYSLDKYKLDILSAHVSCDYFRSMFMIHAQANGTPDSFQEALPLEEIFKSAVQEIMSWIS